MGVTTVPREELLTAKEQQFLREHPLGRLATTTAKGAPTVVPVTAELGDDAVLAVTGFQVTRSVKWANLDRDPRFAYVVDDGIGETAVGILVRGQAELHADDERILLVATHVVTWGIESHPFTRVTRRAAAGGARPRT